MNMQHPRFIDSDDPKALPSPVPGRKTIYIVSWEGKPRSIYEGLPALRLSDSSLPVAHLRFDGVQFHSIGRPLGRDSPASVFLDRYTRVSELSEALSEQLAIDGSAMTIKERLKWLWCLLEFERD
jgi:hypothetical protein